MASENEETNSLGDASAHEEKTPIDPEPDKGNYPRDKFYLNFLLFFLLGICEYLPSSFFGAANNFWLYKFRNTSDPNNLPGNRTFLAKNYASANAVASIVPPVIILLLNATLLNKIPVMKKVVVSLIIEIVIFVLVTISVKIDTDDYQVLFFVLLLVVQGILSGANILNIITTMTLFPKFPASYMKIALIGGGAAGVMNNLLNILTLLIYEGDIIKSTFTYFIFGTVFLTVTLICTILISQTKLFRYCMRNENPMLLKKRLPPKKEMIAVVVKLKFIAALLVVYFLGNTITISSVKSLVVSENKDGVWATAYFSPVMSYLLADVAQLVGRFISSYFPVRMTQKELLTTSVARTVIMAPLIWLCNIQPKHLPVLFPHDYEYGIILAVFMTTSGYIMNTATLLVPGAITEKEVSIAYTVFSLGSMIFQLVISPLAILVPNIV